MEDVGGAIRAGEELDAAAVDAWLKTRMPGLEGSPIVTQFSGGASNWTYRLQYEKDDLILRRPPAGTKSKSSHDMAREFTVQQALRPVFPLVPEMIAHCADASVIGAEFYVMRRIPGVIPRRRMPVALSPEQARRLCEAYVDTLAALHRADAGALASLGKGPGYARRQIEGWSDRYRKARTWNVPSFEPVMRWLHERIPEDSATCLIHNDFRLDNLVLDPHDPTRIVGVLDWEMATLGDPLMDLGNSLAYWVQADDGRLALATRRQPSHLPGMMTRAQLIEQRAGLPRRDMTFYEVYGVFRLAGIVQQIYYRYHHKQTRNPAFRNFWLVTHYLHARCRRLMRRR
jgi:aminoglycoside phosphotransferase (APT) family kinase protein